MKGIQPAYLVDSS